MEENRKSYRIRTAVGNEAPAYVNVDLKQTFDTVDLLSLEIDSKNFYKMPAAGYGVIVGRVIANGGFGVPNAKVSVFIPYDRNSLIESENFLYHYTTPLSKGGDGIRYNLLPRHLDEECHQDVGSMYEKEYLLNNNDFIQVFEKYYKYTAITNESGDYFIYGVPVGRQIVHVDLDLSDIGALSQRPRDLMYSGYSADMFENPNMFKKDKNLNILSQIHSQDKVVEVYPFWGDTTTNETNGIITRCDIEIDYKFEATCVFMGCIVSDTSNRAISQRCVPDKEIGKMSELVGDEGNIEMIRKTFDGKVEEFVIQGNNLIDSDGVWCYQIPMNLDYVMTDEYGNLVPTGDTSKGIATRARVRFRIGMNETGTDDAGRKRARFLVPNNPKLNSDYPSFNSTHEADYEFGTFTKEENYRDLFWNKVYTVKSYIPRLQKSKVPDRRVHTGIKTVNHAGANNPFPFNNISIRLTFLYRFVCFLLTQLCTGIFVANTTIFSVLGVLLYWNGWLFSKLSGALHTLTNLFPPAVNQVFNFLTLGLAGASTCALDLLAYINLNLAENVVITLPNFCQEGNVGKTVYAPMTSFLPGLSWVDLMNDFSTGEKEPIIIQSMCIPNNVYQFPSDSSKVYDSDLGSLFNCVENLLAQDQECTSFNFANDWVNGALYAPLWYRKVQSKKRIFFNLIQIKAKDQWCSGKSTENSKGLSLCQTCAQKRVIKNKTSIEPIPYENITLSPILPPTNTDKENTCYGYKCHNKSVSFINLNGGLIVPIETIKGETVYYYKSVEYDNSLHSQEGGGMGDVKTLFATDIVLLGSLNPHDYEGVPQFFKRLESTTYNMPPDLVQIDYDSDVRKIKFEKKDTINAFLKAMLFMNFGDMGLSEVEDEVDESGAISVDDVYTVKSGADWGNYGRDQVTEDYRDNVHYIFSTNERRRTPTYYADTPDVGGLFYGLTCWSAYTKPKSCINMSRVCEYGVSLDETQNVPVYTQEQTNTQNEHKQVAPDGFISYDEIADKDGRAMFATMNGNNLRTKINPKNGYPVYDFMYLYPENFDGSMRDIMRANISPGIYPLPQMKNYMVEESSEAYLRFRYGRNRDDWNVGFYNSDEMIGLYNEFGYLVAENKNRFPKYENSFYFYFGLTPGKTAIDKFRTQYYSECTSDDSVKTSIEIEYKANEWCSEICDNGEVIPGDGWLKINAKSIDTPYDLYLANMDGYPEYDVWANDIVDEKCYFSFSGSIQSFEENGFVRLSLYRHFQNVVEQYGLVNGSYRLTIIDANGEKYVQYISFSQPNINASVRRSPFRVSNENLQNISNLWLGDFYNNVATLGGKNGETMSDRSDIGGFIEVTDVNLSGDKNIDYVVEIKPEFDISALGKKHIELGFMVSERQNTEAIAIPTSYNGSTMTIHKNSMVPICNDGTLMGENFYDIQPYCPYGYDFPGYPQTPNSPGDQYQTNGGNYDFRFGVPVGGKNYAVTVTLLCNKNGDYYRSRNSVTFSVNVPEPLEFKMLVNGVDYNIIRNFGLAKEITPGSGVMYYGTGWELMNNGIGFPDNYVIDDSTFKTRVIGWDNMDDIDGLVELDYVPDGMENEYDWSYDVYIKATEEKLTNNYSGSSPYNWVDEFVFDSEIVYDRIGKYNSVPENKQSGVAFIMVLYEGDYVFYKWDDSVEEYVLYTPEGVPVTSISTKEYYDYSDLEVKNDYISELNALISIRKEFVESVKNAFIMKQNAPYSLEVNAITNETPVKTLIYYSPDEEYGTSDDYIPLSINKNENVCYGITVPTLTGLLLKNGLFMWHGAQNQTLRNLGDIWAQPLNDVDSIYKKPYIVAVQNAIGETFPEKIKISQSTSQHGIDSDIDDLAPNMFGVHMVDKRLRLVYNTWSVINEWPFYDETRMFSGSMSGMLHSNLISRPGLFAGFVLDGTPLYDNSDSNVYGIYPETHFVEQRLGDTELNIITLTVNPNGEVEENRLPVVRFICKDEAETNYIDYQFVNGNIDSLFNNEISMYGKKHYTFTDLFTKITVKDDSYSYVMSLYGEVLSPNVSFVNYDDNDMHAYEVNASFEEGWCYTFYNGITNPVYSTQNNLCFVFNNPYLQGNNSGTMYFDDITFNRDVENEYNSTKSDINTGAPIWALSVSGNTFKKLNYLNVIENQYNVYPMTTVYAVRLSDDGQRRTVSKTFDLTQMVYSIKITPEITQYELQQHVTNQIHDIVMDLNVGVRKQTSGILSRGFYYLGNHTFSVNFYDENIGDIIRFDIEGGYENNNLISFYTNTQTKWIEFKLKTYQIGESSDEIINLARQLINTETCHAYITDITGLVREMKLTHEEFNYAYCLFEE